MSKNKTLVYDGTDGTAGYTAQMLYGANYEAFEKALESVREGTDVNWEPDAELVEVFSPDEFITLSDSHGWMWDIEGNYIYNDV